MKLNIFVLSRRAILITLLLIITRQAVFSQVSVAGITCVAPGIPYQYIIGGMDSATTIRICVQGGIIGDSSNNCQSGTGINLVNIIWDSASVNGSITVTSSNGNTSFSVSVALPIQGGIIDTANKIQFIAYDSSAAKLTCPSASGGNCNPVYAYQWQRSSDQVDWTDVAGANDQDLAFTFSLQQPTFFRRKVTETVSGSIGYSDIATVFVNLPLGGSN